MKKLFLLVLSACSLMACAALQPQPAFDWRGQDFDEYVLKYGVPTAQVMLQSGNIAYSYITQCSYSPEIEETTVMVNPENIITGVSKKGSCPSATQVRQEHEHFDIFEQINYDRKEREKQKQRDRIAEELLNMGTELKQQAHLLRVETEAVVAESKQNAGWQLTEEEKQKIQAAQQARQNFANWKKRHDELRSQLESLR